jgi:hypothetical protein
MAVPVNVAHHGNRVAQVQHVGFILWVIRWLTNDPDELLRNALNQWATKWLLLLQVLNHDLVVGRICIDRRVPPMKTSLTSSRYFTCLRF